MSESKRVRGCKQECERHKCRQLAGGQVLYGDHEKSAAIHILKGWEIIKSSIMYFFFSKWRR